MSPNLKRLRFLGVFLLPGWCSLAAAGTWSDTFSQPELGKDWQGDRNFFAIADGTLKGWSAQPVAPSPFHRVEVGNDWSDYTVQCQVNVIAPNLTICTKGALVLRDNGTDGYVFALHVATRTIEVYRLGSEEMLLWKQAPLEMKRWYAVRAELRGPTMNFFVDDEWIGTVTDDRARSGRVGVAVQDAMDARFDDFKVTGPDIAGNGLQLTVGENLTISWPVALSNYVLQTSGELMPTASWQTVTNAPSTDGDQRSVTLDVSVGSRFYRLAPAPGN